MFFLLRNITKGVAGGISNGGAKPGSKAADYNPAFVLAAFIIGLVSIVYMIATDHLNPALLTFDIISIAVLLFIGMLVPEHAVQQKVLDKYVSDHQYTPAEMRARADQLTYAATVVDVPADWRPQSVPYNPTPEPVVPSPSLSGPQGRIATMQAAIDDDELTERMMRVAGILYTPCPVCDAGEAQICGLLDNEPWYLLDDERDLIAHGRRIGHAVKEGNAKITDVVAQFDGPVNVPDEVWKAAL